MGGVLSVRGPRPLVEQQSRKAFLNSPLGFLLTSADALKTQLSSARSKVWMQGCSPAYVLPDGGLCPTEMRMHMHNFTLITL